MSHKAASYTGRLMWLLSAECVMHYSTLERECLLCSFCTMRLVTMLELPSVYQWFRVLCEAKFNKFIH